MANTRSSTLSVRLKPETKKRLAKLAKASGRSSNFLIADAVDSYVADQERLSAEIRQGDREIASGHYVKDEDMRAWLLSWGTKHELPPPKCVCGKNHDEDVCSTWCGLRWRDGVCGRSTILLRAINRGRQRACPREPWRLSRCCANIRTSAAPAMSPDFGSW
jgi:predicted transcriptional regulator